MENLINLDLRSKTFAKMQNLYPNLRNIHNLENSKLEQRNGVECPLKGYFLAVPKSHVETNHSTAQHEL